MREDKTAEAIAKCCIRHARAMIEEAENIRKCRAMYERLCSIGYTEHEIDYYAMGCGNSITIDVGTNVERLSLAKKEFGNLELLYKQVESVTDNTARITLCPEAHEEGETRLRFDYIRNLDDSDDLPGKCKIVTITREETQLVCEI